MQLLERVPSIIIEGTRHSSPDVTLQKNTLDSSVGVTSSEPSGQGDIDKQYGPLVRARIFVEPSDQTLFGPISVLDSPAASPGYTTDSAIVHEHPFGCRSSSSKSIITSL